MYDEDAFIPLSALQHLIFCERQCALIHIERAWKDNALTLLGSRLHKRVDESGPRRERRGDVLIARGVPLRSFRLGLSGLADLVEFHCSMFCGDSFDHERGLPNAVVLTKGAEKWTPFPVEYKRGKPKPDRCDEVQLCAQAFCLEEMLQVAVPEGALFYGRIQRRQTVSLDHELRRMTEHAAARLHALIDSGVTPKADRTAKCKQCSMIELCLPHAMRAGRSAKAYLRLAIDQLTEQAVDGS